jgi:hypothetical protein
MRERKPQQSGSGGRTLGRKTVLNGKVKPLFLANHRRFHSRNDGRDKGCEGKPLRRHRRNSGLYGLIQYLW